jgi:hypothetical protein
MNKQENVKTLVEEYRILVENSNNKSYESLMNALVQNGDWSQQAAIHLLQLARGYGSFMLRNALALSLAMNMEDGELGF